MKNIAKVTLTLTILAGATSAFAQEGSFRHGLGYLFVAPTVESEGERFVWQGGGGGEFRLANGLGFGAEIGGIHNLLQVSFNPYFHFNTADPSGKWVPYITGGFTGVTNGEFGERWFNFGGGGDYWFKERIGMRLGFQNMVDLNHDDPWHYAGFRVGFTWR